jgi:hypothetical protein
MTSSKQITQEIQQHQGDVLAEVVLDQLLENGVQSSGVWMLTNKYFFRKFSRDIFSIIFPSGKKRKEAIRIETSRAGLYDHLPEGIFFQPAETSSRSKSAGEMAEEYKQNKAQEIETRKFFAPLENEFFFSRRRNFHTEKQLLQGLNNESLNTYFSEFWNFPKDIPSYLSLRLILLLPYAHNVAGNALQMGKFLAELLDEDVSCSLITTYVHAGDNESNTLGNLALGSELICGNQFSEELYSFRFTIGPLRDSVLSGYLPGGNRNFSATREKIPGSWSHGTIKPGHHFIHLDTDQHERIFFKRSVTHAKHCRHWRL